MRRHVFQINLFFAVLWLGIGLIGTFTVGRVHVHHVETVALQQRAVSRQLPALRHTVAQLTKQATTLNQQLEHLQNITDGYGF